MRIAVVGGGPAGLAFAAFARLADPPDEVTVWERHQVEDTYGFGVILPPAALDTIHRADPLLADALAPRLAGWDEITVHRHGRSLTTRAPRLGAMSRRALLRLLRQRCAQLGVRLHQGAPAPGAAALAARYDLVVAADGARSATRDALAGRFGTTTERIAPDYVWLGAERAFDGLAFILADTPRGPVTAHTYPYEPGRSTFLVEAAHRPGTDELARLFAGPLAGARLLENRSRWSRFLQVRNSTWSSGNVVLLGDAAHTAHYSIGSGTRLALDDAHALVTALRCQPSLPAALAAYEAARRPAVEHTQRIGRASAAWFAGLAEAGDAPPERFLVDLVTRGGRVSMRDLAADTAGAVPADTAPGGR
ncbi:FAD-dependent monooxygenase [Streptomyces sp. SS8]